MIDVHRDGSEYGKRYGVQGQGSGRMPGFGPMLTDEQIQPSSNTFGACDACSCCLAQIGLGDRDSARLSHRHHLVVHPDGQRVPDHGDQHGRTPRLPRRRSPALAGWMFLMGCVWWIYGIGLQGPEPTWEPVSGRTVLQDRRRSTRPACSTPRSRSPRMPHLPSRRRSSRTTLLDRGLGSSTSRRRRSARHRPPRPRSTSSSRVPSRPASSRSSTVFDKGGERYPKSRRQRSTSWRSSTSRTTPWSRRAVRPAAHRTGPCTGAPVVDETRPPQYVYMIRDLGARRQPAGRSSPSAPVRSSSPLLPVAPP